jgi:hypothetical protein
MAGPTSLSLALAVLVLLPFDIITWVLRFYIRITRRAWGPDDWSMVVAIVSNRCESRMSLQDGTNRNVATLYALYNGHAGHCICRRWEKGL